MTTLALEPPGTVRGDADVDLVEGLRRRDSRAADRLVALYSARAYRLAIGITRNGADAEEVVQDAFWSVIRSVHTFRGDARFGSWLYRIVANAAFQKMRGAVHRRGEISLDELLPTFHEASAAPSPIDDWSGRLDDPTLRSDLRAALSTAIDELSPEHRAVVVAYDVEGVPMDEVARALGITVANAKTRLHRARLFLRKRLATFMEGTAPRPMV